MPKDCFPPARLLHDHSVSCSDRSGSKVRFPFVDLVTFYSPLPHTRTYAITGKKKWVAGTLYSIFTLQFGLSIYTIFWDATGPS